MNKQLRRNRNENNIVGDKSNTVKHSQQRLKIKQPSENLKTKWIWLGVILVVTFISFYPSLKNSFNNWDDNAYVFENLSLNKPITEAIPYFFGPRYFVGNYIPVTMIAYTLELQSGGMKPEFFHMINLILHLLNVMLVFWFIYLLSSKKIIVASIVSLFFGIHPMHVESVAWVAELKDVLYTFFFLCGLIAYYKYISNKEKKDYKLLILTFLLFAISILSKPAAVVFPLVLLLLDYYIIRKTDIYLWIEKIPFFIVSILFGIITINAQTADRLLHDFYPFSQRIFFAAHSFLEYIIKLLIPYNLSIFYPYPKIINGQLPLFYYLSPLIILALFYGVYRTLKHSRLITFGFLFFCVNILLVLQFVSVGDAIMADRYTYVPYIGLFFIIAMGFHHLYHSNNSKLSTYKKPALITIIILVIICCYVTNSRCEVWKDSDSLAIDLLNKFPDDRLALNNQAYLLYEHKQYDESIPLFKKAIQMRPDYSMAYINLSNVYSAKNDLTDALKVIDTAIQHKPDDYDLYNRKGNILNSQNKFDEALIQYKIALKIKPDYYKAYYNMSKNYDAMNNFDSALICIDNAIKIQPDDYQLINAKGYLLFNNSKYDEAVKSYNESIKLKPDYTTAYINLSQSYFALKDYENSLKTLDAALKYSPNDYILLNNKGYNLFMSGNAQGALDYYKQSLKNNPDYITAYVNLANCYRSLKDYDNALQNIDVAIRSLPSNYTVINNKGEILLDMRKYKDALDLFMQAIKLNPQFVDAYINVGNCYGSMQDYDNAIQYFKKSLELSLDNPDIYRKLGLSYQNKGDMNTANTYYAKQKQLEVKK